jgi:hypothetical protein
MALAASSKHAVAIRYTEDSGLNAPVTSIATFCERILLDAGWAVILRGD